MNDNSKKQVKTYISEANQNRISETLIVEEDAAKAVKNSESDLKPDELSTGGAIPPQAESEEPELLSAKTTSLPPTTATAEAEAVAGLPVGGTYGEEGEVKVEESVQKKKS